MHISLPLSVLMTVVLAACGGGGGGGGADPAPERRAAHLCQSGLEAGTVELGEVGTEVERADGLPMAVDSAVVLMDDCQALAAWTMPATLDETSSIGTSTFDASLNPSGQWTPDRDLDQQNLHAGWGLRLRVNSAGTAVLGWMVEPATRGRHGVYAARLYKDGGMEQLVTKVDSSYPGASSDLDILPGNVIVTSHVKGESEVQVHAHRDSEQAPTVVGRVVEQADLSVMDSYFVTSPDSVGRLLWRSADRDQPGAIELKVAEGSLEQGMGPAHLIGRYYECTRGWVTGAGSPAELARPWTAATSPTPYSAVAMVAPADRETHRCPLQLIRLDHSAGPKADSMQMSSPDKFIPVAPALVMDEHGNALAVWKEAVDNGPFLPAQLMWSVSIQGGTWSEPKAVPNLAEIGSVVSRGSIALAMNGDGKAVAAVIAQDGNSAPANEFVVYGRFDFTGKWSEWKKTANTTRLSAPKVAINRSGAAVLVYTAANPRPRDTPVSRRAYALRF
ncbi:hypothetical protein OOT46_28670 [Aquabacterium sp. A7-Y]|uniref:hypothetical protein n=1 Tax=Aquabacterium sp. A7-Y TaxID=1349605 RepID=UPI00223E5A20|nr:hypothetical protein [Aquabacterium sp. A7-Y]MCW7541776.1 hypothetical protein [Aquabacterium sp. A7-Y]